jgi:hypothetical protein
MAPENTTLNIVPDWDKKLLQAEGKISVHETVEVYIEDAADGGEAPEGMVLRLTSLCGRRDYGRFPLHEEDQWEVSGDGLFCRLNLNTKSLIREFRGLCADDRIPVRISLESGVANNLYATGRMHIRNWPQDAENPTVNEGVLSGRISELDEQLNTLHDAFIVHKHLEDGTDESLQLDHRDLDNVGTLTHAQLEEAVGANTSNLGGHIIDYANPHQVTAEQLGLGNVDNTSDALKPVSAATQNALKNKADKSVVDQLLSDLSGATALNNINPDTSTDYNVRLALKGVIDFLKGVVQ